MSKRVPQLSTTDYYRAPVGSQESTVDYFKSVMPSLDGVGSFIANTTPIAMAAKKLREKQQFAANGLGGTEIGTGAYLAALVVVLGLGALSYQAGKAMAPTKQSETTWGWVGVPMGLFLPFGMGLGVMGVISNSQKR